MIEHLQVRRRAGENVLEDALEESKAEIAESGDLIAQ